MSFIEHLEKIPFLLSLFAPIIIFFLFGLWLARSRYKKDHKRLKKAVEENDHLAADLTRALAPEKSTNQSLLSRIEEQKSQWSKALKAAEDALFTEQCRTRDLTNQIESLQTDLPQTPSPASPDLSLEVAEKEQQIQLLTLQVQDLQAAAQAQTTDDPSHLNSEDHSNTLQLVQTLKQENTDYQLQLENNQTTLQRKDETISTLQAELERSKQPPSPQIQTSLDLPSGEDELEEDPTYGTVFKKRPARIDDLKLIKGVGKVLEDKLHRIGIYHFRQIAQWSPDQIKAFEKRLSFKNRITRDQWLKQAHQFHQNHHGEEL